jgi:Helicase C-terminal domain/Type III restriction enzyme, res subunit
MPLKYDMAGSGQSADTVTDPQKLFQALPAKAKKYAYLRDVQGDVLGKWHTSPKEHDTIIKMNTGGGKTIVGLLLLKSCLNEGVAPAIYVAPDHYLCSQVEKEAYDLGLRTTSDPRSADFQAGRAILVAPIQVVFNGMSKFGVSPNQEIQIGSIVIDDAHACLAIVEQQFTLRIERDQPGFEPLVNLFVGDLQTQSITGTQEIISGDPRGFVQVPFWAWQEKQSKVVGLLSKHLVPKQKDFVWPLVKEDIATARGFVSTQAIEISSRCLPVDVIPSFEKAKRRIYMTATLSDDSVLITDFGANPAAVEKPITPKTASDLGERMILVPQEINTDLSDDQIKDFVVKFSESENVVVIVPSGTRAHYWSDVATEGMILTAENIDEGIKSLRDSKGNLAILVNKYDGIDLPDDTCRILVIDGIPDTRRLLDRYEQGTLSDSDRYLSRQVQRIEQGMGRAIRSNEDYCVVICMGSRLLQALYAQGAVRHFSPATKRQLELSRKIAAQMSDEGLDAMAEAINDVLDRNKGWVAAAKNALIEVGYAEVVVDQVSVLQRQAYDAFRRGKYEHAVQVLQDAADSVADPRVKGWLLEQAAEALHRIDKAGSQTLLAAAGDKNSRITKPLAGIAYKKISTEGMNQSLQAMKYLSTKYPSGGNAIIIGMNGILESLAFIELGSDQFEEALKELGLHLGFHAQRPEKEKSGKLDVLWGIGIGQYILFPCKSSATASAISKQYADQVSGNMNWFMSTYGKSSKGTPVIVHPATIFETDAFPPDNTRVLGKDELAKLHAACMAFATAIKDDLNNVAKLKASLSANSLLGNQFLQTFTIAAKKKKSK